MFEIQSKLSDHQEVKDIKSKKIIQHDRNKGHTLSQASILVVDDEPINIEILSSMLQEMGYKIDQASQG